MTTDYMLKKLIEAFPDSAEDKTTDKGKMRFVENPPNNRRERRQRGLLGSFTARLFSGFTVKSARPFDAPVEEKKREKRNVWGAYTAPIYGSSTKRTIEIKESDNGISIRRVINEVIEWINRQEARGE